MKTRPTATITRTDADGFASIDDQETPTLVILEISRREVEERNFTSSLERLMGLADTRESTLRYRENLAIMITGYESDRRELPEIPEVRAFFALLVNEWPHWLWFLARDEGGISLFMSLICDVRIHRAHGQFGIEFTDIDRVERRFQDLLQRGIALFEAFDIPSALAEQSAQSAVEALLGS